MANGRLISSISTETKLYKLLYLTDLIVLLAGFGLFFTTHTAIQVFWIKLLYALIIVVMCVWIIYQPPKNPKKRNYQVLIMAFKRDKNVYCTTSFSEMKYYDKELRERNKNKRLVDLTKID